MTALRRFIFGWSVKDFKCEYGYSKMYEYVHGTNANWRITIWRRWLIPVFEET